MSIYALEEHEVFTRGSDDGRRSKYSVIHVNENYGLSRESLRGLYERKSHLYCVVLV